MSNMWLLQTQAPKLHKLKSDTETFLKDLLMRFVVIKASEFVFDVPYNNSLNKNDEDISVGSETLEWF